jgi:hypothetical protein
MQVTDGALQWLMDGRYSFATELDYRCDPNPVPGA